MMSPSYIQLADFEYQGGTSALEDTPLHQSSSAGTRYGGLSRRSTKANGGRCPEPVINDRHWAWIYAAYTDTGSSYRPGLCKYVHAAAHRIFVQSHCPGSYQSTRRSVWLILSKALPCTVRQSTKCPAIQPATAPGFKKYARGGRERAFCLSTFGPVTVWLQVMGMECVRLHWSSCLASGGRGAGRRSVYIRSSYCLGIR
ncbi:hypothetical protein AVEN_182116-1 [Araneus ventricosus]|uniref:Uncharacterized protein n=1 Tax=Araneus ventricosus TaxID=182803 RepID=A0A4Y2UJK2_ARAVE|nr:hypothetical protein AVEN_182116-1 [Araneus ventricosus]